MTTDLKRRQEKRGTAAAWTSANPTLLAGEWGLETDTRRWKCGDGSTAWNSLAYFDAELASKAGFTDTYVAKSDDFIYLDASRFQGQSGAPSYSGSAGIGADLGWVFADAGTRHVVAAPMLPSWWVTFDVDLVWLNGGAGSGDVRWWLEVHRRNAPNETALAAAQQTITASAQNVEVTTTGFLTGATATPGVRYRFSAIRDGNHVADTLTNNVLFRGLIVRRAS